MQKRKRVLIASAAYNWAETHRMVSIGEEFTRQGYEVYSLGIGAYSSLLKKTMNYVKISADSMWYTEERIKRLMNMDEYGNDYCTEQELELVLSEEIELLKQIKPNIVITGYRMTLSVSCRYLNIPLVWVWYAVVSPRYFQLGLATMPNRGFTREFTHIFDRIKDKKKKNSYYCKLALIYNSRSKVWNKINKKYGLKPFQSDLDIYAGDFNLLSDVPELFHKLMPLPKNYDFCGPLFNEQDITECRSLIHYKDTGKVKIFVTMGSSGEKEILLRILNILKEADADVFVSCTSILNEDDRTGFSSNFYFEKAYPHKQIAELVDFSIIHGGQGTVYTTLVAGKPYIGIPMFSEQQYNLENLQSYESGILLYESELSRESLLNCVHKILNEKEYRMNAKKLSNIVTGYYSDDDKRAAKVAFEKIRDFFNET